MEVVGGSGAGQLCGRLLKRAVAVRAETARCTTMARRSNTDKSGVLYERCGSTFDITACFQPCRIVGGPEIA